MAKYMQWNWARYKRDEYNYTIVNRKPFFWSSATDIFILLFIYMYLFFGSSHILLSNIKDLISIPWFYNSFIYRYNIYRFRRVFSQVYFSFFISCVPWIFSKSHRRNQSILYIIYIYIYIIINTLLGIISCCDI